MKSADHQAHSRTSRDASEEQPIGRTELAIEGMSCTSCVRKIEKSLGALKGVADANVNFAAGTATVSYDPEAVSIKDMIETVGSLGYSARPESPARDSSIDATEPVHDAHRHADSVAGLRIRVFVAAALTAPLLILAMHHGRIPFLDFRGQEWVQMLLAAPVTFGCGWVFFRRAWSALVHRSTDMNTLIAMGAGSAFLFSAATTIFPSFARFIQPGHAGHAMPPIYFEAAAVIITLILLGKYLEEKARLRAGDAIRRLMDLQPETAIVRHEAEEREVPIAEIKPHDTVVLKPGARVPVDGTVIVGETSIDESMLTGESIPSHRAVGDKVYAGTINLDGSVDFGAERTGHETALARIIDRVRSAQSSKPPIARLADRISAVFVPIVIIIAVLSAAGWLAFGPSEFAASMALNTFVSVLIVACPCALGLATPAAIMAGTGRGAEAGLLIRDADALEKALRVTQIAFDKTGTLTTGQLRILHVDPTERFDEETLLSLAAAAEVSSEHPIGKAIVLAARERSLPIPPSDGFRAFGGRGVTANAGGQIIHVGKQSFLSDNGIAVDAPTNASGAQSAPLSHVHVGANGAYVGSIGIVAELRPEALRAVGMIHDMGIKTSIITGDSAAAARAVADQLSIGEVASEVLPERKAEAVQKMQERGEVVGMVGDGINDAPALAQADIGIAMGTGTAAAMETAGITLLRSDLLAVPDAISLSRATVRTIRQNLFWAFFYNALAIPLAAGLLYPITGWLLSPIIASAAMAFSSVFVLLQSRLPER